MLELKHELKLDKSRDEKARMNFVSALRAHVLNDMATGMRAVFDADVEPAFRRATGRAPTNGPEVHKSIKANEYFKFYSSLRVTAQDMVWQSVFPPLERNRPQLKDKAARLARRKKFGSLQLKEGFEVPRYVSAIDVHLMAGNYDGEYEAEDLAAGALYDNGLAVFSFGLMGQNLDDIGQSIAGFIRLKFPNLKPKKILDLGCTIGHNTGSWKDQFPEAEVHGIDVAAPCLRYAHARAQAQGREIHFHQMNAEQLDFPDASFDVVFRWPDAAYGVATERAALALRGVLSRLGQRLQQRAFLQAVPRSRSAGGVCPCRLQAEEFPAVRDSLRRLVRREGVVRGGDASAGGR